MKHRNILLALVAAFTVTAPLEAATIAAFHFGDPMTSANFADITGNGHGVTFNRPVSTNGNTPFSTGYSLGLSINSTVGKLTNPDTMNFRDGEGGGSFTLEGWINPSEVGHMVFIAMTTADQKNTIQLAINSDGEPEARFRTGGQAFVRATSGASVTATEWVHLALVYNHESQILSLFVNASEVASETIGYVLLPEKFDTVSFGGDGTNQVKGLIADLRFSDVALAAGELGFHAPIPEPSLALASAAGVFTLFALRGRRMIK